MFLRDTDAKTEIGTGVIILGGVSNLDDDRDWPTARYVTDGIPGEELHRNASQLVTYLLSHNRGLPNALLRFQQPLGHLLRDAGDA